MYQPKRVLVTGSAGFIGSNFVHYLLKKDNDVQVISVDKLTYAGSISHLIGLDLNRHQLVVGDIANASLIYRVLRENFIDTIIHFAAESHVDRSIASPAAFIEANIVGTFVLLEEARQYWQMERGFNETQCRFHHVSTDEVYGSLSSDAPAFTEIHPYQPSSPYSASKAASDHLVRAYYHTYGLPVTISNCSNNYGPHQHDEKFIPTVIRACLEKLAIPLYGSGLNVRDWLYVEDHVDAIDCIVRNAAVGSTYHIGGQAEKTNREVVEAICGLMNKHYPSVKPYQHLITPVSDRSGHDWRYAMNIEKIQKELGWVPKVAFSDGLARTLAYYLKREAIGASTAV
jgi:dTDP-glucose 4,6-dehydratase